MIKCNLLVLFIIFAVSAVAGEGGQSGQPQGEVGVTGQHQTDVNIINANDEINVFQSGSDYKVTVVGTDELGQDYYLEGYGDTANSILMVEVDDHLLMPYGIANVQLQNDGSYTVQIVAIENN